MPIDRDRPIEQSQSLGNPVFGYRIEHCKRSEVEIVGAETEFVDLRAAWDALPEARQRELDGLVVEHSIFRSRSQIGFADFNDDIFKQLPPVPQALVRHHRYSGRTSLYLASHASHIIGWPVEEGGR